LETYAALRKITDPTFLELEDEFLGGGITSGTIGNIGWTETSSAAGTNSLQAGGVGKGSVFRLTTGAVLGNNKRIHLGATASDPIILPTSSDRFRFCVRIPIITTVTVRIGLMQDVSAAAGGTAGAFVEFDPASAATWRGITRQASVSSTPAVLGSAVIVNNWYFIEVRRRPSGTVWELLLNGNAAVTLTTQLPTTACNFGALLQTGAAAARNLDFDYAYLRGDLGQRFT
jgi:hypothetical protein